jgi:hypothetical protein
VTLVDNDILPLEASEEGSVDHGDVVSDNDDREGAAFEESETRSTSRTKVDGDRKVLGRGEKRLRHSVLHDGRAVGCLFLLLLADGLDFLASSESSRRTGTSIRRAEEDKERMASVYERGGKMRKSMRKKAKAKLTE